MTTRKKLLQCPECRETFNSPQNLGKHRRFKHGVHGTAHSRGLAATTRATGDPADASNPLQCPHCTFLAKGPSGISWHLASKHHDYSRHLKPSRYNPKEKKALAKIKPQTLNGQAHQDGEGHPDAIPPALIAVASGRFIELCRSMAFEHDVPPRLFAARVAAFVYGATVR